MNTSDLIVHCKDFAELDRDLVLQKLDKHQFCLIRGLICKKALAQGTELLHQFIETNDDRACTGEAPDEVHDYFMKMSIGLGNHSGHKINRSRFMRTVYLPLDKPDRFGLVSSFKIVASIRNILMGKNIDFAINHVDEGLWTAARVHHFPIGGGHMVTHKDTLAPNLLKDIDESYNYFQPILVMSQKGSDFQNGGGVAMVGGELVEYEDFCEFGDIAIYDVSTVHGVNEVDLDRPFQQRSSSGRYSGLVTLYKQIPPAMSA